MKLLMPCLYCAHSEVQSKESTYTLYTGLPKYITFVDLQDDNLYRTTCPFGHESVTYVQNPKFELLFDSGALALLDGYPREAVSSLAAALERFYEFYIRIRMQDQKIPAKEFDRTWSLVRSQSERQVGAFLFMYLLDNKSNINFDIQKNSEFRNKIIHQGYIPTEQQVHSYANQVLLFIRTVLADLLIKYKASVLDTISADAKKSLEKLPETTSVVNMSIPTIIRTQAAPENDMRTFEQSLEQLQAWKPYA